MIDVAANKHGLFTYIVNMVEYNSTQTFDAQCNSIQFINKGDTVAIINGIKLFPQQSLAIDGNLREWDMTNYNLSFDQTNGGTYNNLTVIRKTYQ